VSISQKRHEHGRSGPRTPAAELRNRSRPRSPSQILGDTARLLPAQIQSGIYRSPTVGETVYHLVQRQSAHSCIAHLKDFLDRPPQVGKQVRIQYAHAKGTVRRRLRLSLSLCAPCPVYDRPERGRYPQLCASVAEDKRANSD